MSWLQQLVGKLKSVFGRKSASGEASTEAGTTPRAETGTAEKPAATEPKAEAEAEPTRESEPVAEAEPEQPPAETPATEAEPVAEEAAAEAVVAEPAAPEATTADSPAAEEAIDEPVAEVAPVEPTEEPAAAEAVEPAVSAAAEEPADSPVATETPAEPVAAAEPAPTKRPELANPALSTLDVDSITAELKAEGPYGPGSGKPAADGAAPSEDFVVKAKESSKLFHTEKSPYFTRTKADVWFKSEADAESAGFQAWDHKKRAAAKK